MPTKPSQQLTLHDKLSRLNHLQAKKLLGPAAAALLPKAGREEIEVGTQVLFTADQFQVTYPLKQVVVTLALHPSYRDRLQMVCSHDGETGDYFRAATIALILEEKLALGLSMPPDENTPWELMPESELENRAVAERAKRAGEEKMKVAPTVKATPWTDYAVTSAMSGKSYRVALRGVERGMSYCSCPDFRKNRLGLCKHVIKVQGWVKKRFDAAVLKKRPKPERLGIYARYDGDLRLGMEIPARLRDGVREMLSAWEGMEARTDEEMARLFDTVRELSQADADFVIYPDAEEVLNQAVHRRRMNELVTEIRKACQASAAEDIVAHRAAALPDGWHRVRGRRGARGAGG